MPEPVQGINQAGEPENMVLSIIIIHPDDLSGVCTRNAFYKSIDHFFHGDGVMTGKIAFVYIHSIFNKPRPVNEAQLLSSGYRWKQNQCILFFEAKYAINTSPID